MPGPPGDCRTRAAARTINTTNKDNEDNKDKLQQPCFPCLPLGIYLNTTYTGKLKLDRKVHGIWVLYKIFHLARCREAAASLSGPICCFQTRSSGSKNYYISSLNIAVSIAVSIVSDLAVQIVFHYCCSVARNKMVCVKLLRSPATQVNHWKWECWTPQPHRLVSRRHFEFWPWFNSDFQISLSFEDVAKRVDGWVNWNHRRLFCISPFLDSVLENL